MHFKIAVPRSQKSLKIKESAHKNDQTHLKREAQYIQYIYTHKYERI